MCLDGLGYKCSYKGVDKELNENVNLSEILKYTLVWIGSLQLKNMKQESLSNRRSARYV